MEVIWFRTGPEPELIRRIREAAKEYRRVLVTESGDVPRERFTNLTPSTTGPTDSVFCERYDGYLKIYHKDSPERGWEPLPRRFNRTDLRIRYRFAHDPTCMLEQVKVLRPPVEPFQALRSPSLTRSRLPTKREPKRNSNWYERNRE